MAWLSGWPSCICCWEGIRVEILIRGGRVIDPAQGIDRHVDGWIVDGKITELGVDLHAPLQRAGSDPRPPPRIIAAQGCVVAPGFLDMHVHLREPGGEHKETIATGLAAAAAGGFTAVAAMANTAPVNDDAEVTRWMLERAGAVGGTRLLPVAAVTRGLAGAALTDFGALRDAGAVAFSDDGMPIADGALMRRALLAAREAGAPIIAHEDDGAVACGGVVDAGPVAERLGVAGMPADAEARMIAR